MVLCTRGSSWTGTAITGGGAGAGAKADKDALGVIEASDDMTTRLGAGASPRDVAVVDDVDGVYVWCCGWRCRCGCGLVGVDESGGVGMRSEPSDTMDADLSDTARDDR